jgi:uncharacterized protein (UPF0333 family)
MLAHRSFIKDSRGSVGILFGVFALAVFAAAGAAIDYGRAVTTRTTLQAATDAAAAAAAASPPDSDAIALATTVFQANYTGSPAPHLDVSLTGDKVTVTAATTVKTSLTAVGGIEEVHVSASAEAETYASPLCILLLEQTQIGLNARSGATLDASECGIHINSTNDSEALSVTSNANITAADVCVVGGSKVSSGGTVTPAPTHGCAAKADPMASLPEPAEASAPCNHTDFKVDNGQTKTMSPGVYCKKTLIDNHGTANMQPGVYVFREGEFLVNSNASVTGSEVMMFFKDKDARLNVNSGSTVTVTAPKSGTYEGVLMFQSRHPDTLSAPPHIFNSNSNTKLEGTVYVPNGILELNSDAAANVLADYTLVIARQMRLNSNGTFQVRSNFSGNTPRPPMLGRFNTTPSARLVR